MPEMAPAAQRRMLVAATVPATIEGFLLPIAARMRQLGWRVDALASGATSSAVCASCFDEVYEASWSRQPLDPRNMLSARAEVRALVAANRYDIVHVHTPVAAFVTRVALRDMQREGTVRVVYTAHGFHFHERGSGARNGAFLALERLAGRWTDQLVVINEHDRDAAIREGIVPRGRVNYMHGIGIDITRYDRDRVPPPEIRRVRDEIGIAENAPLFACVAEFIPRKRQQLVVRALAGMRHQEAHVAFLGDGPTRGEVEKLAHALGAASRAHFLGMRADVPVWLAASSASVLYSDQEGLSRAVMESLAMRVPVIGADIRGIRELLTDGCGVVVDADDMSALARALDAAIDDPAELAAMGERGRRRMAGPYEQARILEAHEELYERTLA